MSDKSTKDLKVCVIGDGGVGKSSFCIQFAQQQWVQEYDPTIEDEYRRTIEIDGKTVIVNILDTAPYEDSYLQDNYYRYRDAFVIIYSITSHRSFDVVVEFLEKIMRVKDIDDFQKVPVWIVGNKLDLEDERQVKCAEGEELARKYNVRFCEMSAKLRINVDEVVVGLATPRIPPIPSKNKNDEKCMLQ